MLVINKEGLVHNCHTQKQYEDFKAAGWKDYVPVKPEKETKKGKPKAK